LRLDLARSGLVAGGCAEYVPKFGVARGLRWFAGVIERGVPGGSGQVPGSRCSASPRNLGSRVYRALVRIGRFPAALFQRLAVHPLQ
jgi:hypothetical protein